MRRYPSAKDLAKFSKPGRYAVGHGAYLQIADGGTRSWLFRYRVGDQQHHMGLGSCAYVTLQEAREKAWEAQRQRLRGVDPLEAKREARAASKPALMTKTFTEAADEYLIAHEAGWRGDGSLLQWRHCLKNTFCPPSVASRLTPLPPQTFTPPFPQSGRQSPRRHAVPAIASS